MSLDQSLARVEADFQANTMKDRKRGLCLLSCILDNSDFLRELDANTASLQRTAKPSNSTWPGLAVLLTKHIEEETTLATQKNKPPKPELSKALKKVLELANNEKRSGCKATLRHTAQRLFAHFFFIISQTTLSSPMGGDYSNMLRNQLLSNHPEYIAAAKVSLLDDLLLLFTNHIADRAEEEEEEKKDEQHQGGRGGGGGDAAHRILSTVEALLVNFPGDMNPSTRKDIASDFLGSILPKKLDKLGADEVRTTTTALHICNAFLLHQGLDVSSIIKSTLHPHWHHIILRALKSKDGRVRDGAVLYIRLVSSLGVFEQQDREEDMGRGKGQKKNHVGWVDDILWVVDTHIIGGERFSWVGVQNKDARELVMKKQYSLMAMVGGLLYWKLVIQQTKKRNTTIATDDDEEEEGEGQQQRAMKRRRIAATGSNNTTTAITTAALNAPCLSLVDLLRGNSKGYGPPIAHLLLHFGLACPREEVENLLNGMEATWKLLVMDDFDENVKDQGVAVWVTRIIHGLALTWHHHHHHHHHHGGGGGSSSSSTLSPYDDDDDEGQETAHNSSDISNTHSSSEYGRKWRYIWDTILDLCRKQQQRISEILFDNCLLSLTAILNQHLVSAPPEGVTTFWELPLYQSAATPVAALFVKTALGCSEKKSTLGSGNRAAMSVHTAGADWTDGLAKWIAVAIVEGQFDKIDHSQAPAALFVSLLHGGRLLTDLHDDDRDGSYHHLSLGALSQQRDKDVRIWKWWQEDSEVEETNINSLLRGRRYFLAKQIQGMYEKTCESVSRQTGPHKSAAATELFSASRKGSHAIVCSTLVMMLESSLEKMNNHQQEQQQTMRGRGRAAPAPAAHRVLSPNFTTTTGSKAYFHRLLSAISTALQVLASVEETAALFATLHTQQLPIFTDTNFACWSSSGPLQSLLQNALAMCSLEIQSQLTSLEGFSAEDELGIVAVRDALFRHSMILQHTATDEDLLTTSFVTSCMDKAGALFTQAHDRAASLVGGAGGGVGMSIPTQATTAANDIELFDEDLDMGGAAVYPHQPTVRTVFGVSTASLVSGGGGGGGGVGGMGGSAVGGGGGGGGDLSLTWQERCVWLLDVLAPLAPENGAETAINWLSSVPDDGLKIETELALVKTMYGCATAMARRIHTSHNSNNNRAVVVETEMMQVDNNIQTSQQSEVFKNTLRNTVACFNRGVDKEERFFSWLFDTPTQVYTTWVEYALRQCIDPLVQALIPLMGITDGEHYPIVKSTLEEFAELLCSAVPLFMQLDGDQKEGREKKLVDTSRWQLRVALSKTITALFHASPVLFEADEMKKLNVGSGIFSLIDDPCYSARIACCRMMQVLFERFTDSRQLFQDACDKITLQQTAPRAGAGAAEQQDEEKMETSILFLSTTAIHNRSLEGDCLLQLINHAAKYRGGGGGRNMHSFAAPHVPLVKAALDWIAFCLQYPHRQSYMTWHRRNLLFKLCHYYDDQDSMVSLSELEVLQPLLATSSECSVNAESYFFSLAPHLVAIAVYRQNRNMLQVFARHIRKTAKELVSRYIADIAALALPLVVSASEEEKKKGIGILTEGLLKELLLTDVEIQNVLGADPPNIMKHVLCLARDGCTDSDGGGGGTTATSATCPELPFQLPPIIQKTIEMYLKFGSVNDIDKIVKGKDANTLLLAIHSQLQQAYNPQHLKMAIGCLSLTIQMLTGLIRRYPSTLRYTVIILLRMLEVDQVAAEVCDMLKTVAILVLQEGNTNANAAMNVECQMTLGKLLPAILSTLIAALVERHPLPAGGSQVTVADTTVHLDAATLKIIGLFNFFAVENWVKLRTYLAEADTIPNLHPEVLKRLSAANKNLTQLKSRTTPTTQLILFAKRASSLSPTLRGHAVDALRKSIADKQDDLYQDEEEKEEEEEEEEEEYASGSTRDGTVNKKKKCKASVKRAAWELAALSADLGDSHLASFSGELLALSGPLEPSVIAFNASAAAGRGNSDNASDTDEDDVWVAVLGQLSDYLVDESVRVIKTAQIAVGKLLESNNCRAAFDKLEEDTQHVLKVYQATEQQQQQQNNVGTATTSTSISIEQANINMNAVAAALEAEDMWRWDQYGSWVSRLAKTVLKHTANSNLIICAGMAQYKPALAELLLPHAFVDIALQETCCIAFQAIHEGKKVNVKARVSGAIRKHLLPQSPHHPKAMRLLFSCLNALRNTHIKARMVPPPSAASSSSSQLLLSSCCAASWSSAYWFDLDYLEVAEAAIHSRALFTAVVYVETWWYANCPGHHLNDTTEIAANASSSNTSSSSITARTRSANQLQIKKAKRLLLEVYSMVKEPDSIYTVAQSHDMMSQLKLYEHEGDWAKALVNYDLVLQLLKEQQHGSSGAPLQNVGFSSLSPSLSAAASIDGVTRNAAVAGLTRCLAELGALHLLKNQEGRGGNIDSTASSSSSLFPAWRASMALGSWDTQQQGKPPSLNLYTAADSNGSNNTLCLSSFSSVLPTSVGDGYGFKTHFDAAVSALNSGNWDVCRNAIAASRADLVAGLVTAGLEAAADVNPALVSLQLIQAVADAWELKWPAMPDLGFVESFLRPTQGNGNGNGIEKVLTIWDTREAQTGASGRYELVSPLQTARIGLLENVGLPEMQAKSLVQLVVTARKAGRSSQATSSLYHLKTLLEQHKDKEWCKTMLWPTAQWRVEEAKLLWSQGQQHAALSVAESLLRQNITDVGSSSNSNNAAVIKAQQGLQSSYLQGLAAKWSFTTRSKSSDTILDSLTMAVQGSDTARIDGPRHGRDASLYEHRAQLVLCRTLYRLASFADKQYRNIVRHKKSTEWQTKKRVIAAKQREYHKANRSFKQMAAQGLVRIKDGRYVEPKSRALRIKMINLEKCINADEREVNEIEGKQPALLVAALSAYWKCLASGGLYDLPCLFRLIQLWFSLQNDPQVNRELYEAAQRVPSYKFLPLSYQMASRITTLEDNNNNNNNNHYPGAEYQNVLVYLLTRLGKDHPHHTLLNIFALKNNVRQEESARLRDLGDRDPDILKARAAISILQEVESSSARLKMIITQMGLLIESYIKLAKASAPTDTHAATMPFPASIRRERQHLDAIPLPTETIPIEPGCQYSAGTFPTFSKFKNTIRFVGGINRPKLCVAIDSNGREHRHLVKGGGDDLRQDAVMQQFFGVVNSFLDDKQETRRRCLRIRRYNVIPLSPYEGLVQFVENTMPLLDYLGGGGGGGGGGALRRYAKKDQIQSYIHSMTEWKKIQDYENERGAQGHMGEDIHEICLQGSQGVASLLLGTISRSRGLV